MNEHMMFRGTPSHASGAIPLAIESKGGHLNAFTMNDRTAYYFFNLADEDLADTIDICGEMVFEANIDPREYEDTLETQPDGTVVEIKGERNAVLEEIKTANDNIDDRQWDLLYKTAYPGQSHARPILGTPASLLGITAKMLKDYRDGDYVANNVVFCAAGPVRHQDFVALIAKKFGHMPTAPVRPLPVPAYTGGTAVLEMEAAKLCQVVIAAPAVADSHPDSHAYSVLCSILGDGDSSRLHRALVNDRMLTRGAGAFVNGFRHCGTAIVSTAASAGNVKEIVNTVYAELRNVRANVTQAELDKVKNRMEMAALKKMEQNEEACDMQGNITLVHGQPQSLQQISAAIQAVTPADVRRVAASILAANPTVTMVAPQGTDPALLPTHAEVTAMRDGTWRPAIEPAPRAPSPAV